METDQEVKVIQVNLKCPDCETILTGKCCPRQDNPDQIQKYQYTCSRCGMSTIEETKYPYIKYVSK